MGSLSATRGGAKTQSPWTLRTRIRMLLWECCWSLLCRWTPKPLNRWRLFWLRLFGARIHGVPFVHQRARIPIPWHLTLHDRSCLGDRTNAYTLGEIEIEAGAIVAQEAYICTGTHDFDDGSLPLVTKKITIRRDAFIGARVFILPGVEVGEGAIVGAGAVVTANVEPFTINAGNPSRMLRKRTRLDAKDTTS